MSDIEVAGVVNKEPLKPYKKNKHKKVNRGDHYIPTGDQVLLNKPIEELNLREKTLEILKAGGVNIVFDLIKYREKELYRIQNFNKKNLIDVTDKVRILGLSFRPEVVPVNPEIKPIIEHTAVITPEQKVKHNPIVNNRPISQSNNQSNSQSNNHELVKENKDDRIRVTLNGKVIEDKDNRIRISDRRNDRRNDFQGKNFNDTRKPKNDNQREKSEATSRNENNNDNYSTINKNNYEGTGSISKKLDSKPTPMKEEKIPQDALVKFTKDNKFGFKDVRGRLIIPALYDDAFMFKEGLSCVEMNGLFGFIDKKNALVIPCVYELAMSFSEGLACVTMNDKSGYIDKEGNIVIELKYDTATAFQDELARVKIDGRWGMLGKDGKVRML